jgi:hypothetical protein
MSNEKCLDDFDDNLPFENQATTTEDKRLKIWSKEMLSPKNRQGPSTNINEGIQRANEENKTP